MKRFLLGWVVSAALIYLYLHGSNAFTPIVGKVVEHRVEGLKEVSGSHAHNISAVDPKTGRVFKKSLHPADITFFLDQESEETQYATWKSNNLYDYDVQYHFRKTYFGIPTSYQESGATWIIIEEILTYGFIVLMGLIGSFLIIGLCCELISVIGATKS